MPAVGATGSKAARTASVLGGFAGAGAAAGFLAVAVAVAFVVFFVELWAVVDLLEVFVVLAEDLLDFVGLVDELLLELVDFVPFFLVELSSVAAPAAVGSAMQQAIVDRSATMRRTG